MKKTVYIFFQNAPAYHVQKKNINRQYAADSWGTGILLAVTGDEEMYLTKSLSLRNRGFQFEF